MKIWLDVQILQVVAYLRRLKESSKKKKTKFISWVSEWPVLRLGEIRNILCTVGRLRSTLYTGTQRLVLGVYLDTDTFVGKYCSFWVCSF